MKTKKKVFNFTSITEYKALEQYFEKMASKGWMLRKANRYSFEFYKIEPQQLKFSIHLYHYESESYYNNKNHEVLSDICEAAGWTLCASNYKYQIYCAYKNEDVIEMHTDSREEYKIVRNIFFKTQFLYIFIIGLIDVLGIITLDQYSYKSPLHLIISFSSDIFTYYALALIINAICWFTINRINVHKDKPLAFLSLRGVIIKNNLMLIFYIVLNVLYYYLFLL